MSKKNEDKNYNKNIIVVHGLKESGKTLLAERFIKKYGYKKVKMADTLKNMLRVLLREGGLSKKEIERCIEGDLKNKPLDILSGKTARFAMMKLGDEWRNFIDKELWVNIAVLKIERMLKKNKKIIIDDIRYPAELKVLSRFNPVKIVITRKGKHFEEIKEDTHPSEIPMPVENFDYVIANDSDSKKLLKNDIDKLVKNI